jgi:hypothetical protein
MCLVFVLDGVDKDFEIIRNQIFINPNIPIYFNFILLMFVAKWMRPERLLIEEHKFC